MESICIFTGHGLELMRKNDSSLVRVFIDYTLLPNVPNSWFGRLLGDVYARSWVEYNAKIYNAVRTPSITVFLSRDR